MLFYWYENLDDGLATFLHVWMCVLNLAHGYSFVARHLAMLWIDGLMSVFTYVLYICGFLSTSGIYSSIASSYYCETSL